ncbi:hypothetical protein ACJMK2_032635 [Sinanodonta woodiana]|uniref:Uncharacterized protein n=1 Tax=Sinanodonta woodiana TaxID=1069815 RepID=A0ABD3X465_SINWO
MGTIKDCQLELSNRGPDWYKIKRPTPEYLQFDADFVQYIHMPCAAGTVFDLKICGCTNLASHLFESLTLISREMERREFSQVTDDKLRGTADDKNNFKIFAPRPTVRPPTFILNTDTGEVKGCPFRSSPLGIRYYMIREYDEKWTNMKCGPVTVFSVKACTCIHESQADMSKESTDSLVVLTVSSHEDKDNQNILSKGLGISVSDIGLKTVNSPPAKAPQVPGDMRDVRTKDRIQAKANIFVPFNSDDTNNDSLGKRVDNKFDQLSKRNFADDPDKKRVPSLSLDTKKIIDTNQLDGVIPLEFKPVINLTRPLDTQEGNRGDKSKSNKLDSTRNRAVIADVLGAINNKVSKDVIDQIKSDKIKLGLVTNIMDEKIKVDLTDNMTNKFVHAATNIARRGDNSEILSVEDGDEFMKKLTDLATKMSESRKDSEHNGDGFRVSAPHGSGPSQVEVAQQGVESGQLLKKEPDDELYFPVVVCHKMKAPELGKQYFKLHLWGIGWIPYRCEEDRIFVYNECACVKERDDDT